MAVADRSAAVAYLGRPCQFLDAEQLARCDPQLWRRGRFGEEVIAAMDRAFDRVKEAYGVKTLNVVGYSGGGTVAALVSARRKDVACLVTIAAPLDTAAWTRAIGVSALDASLNPLDVAERLAGVPQTHFRGNDDTLVPASSVERFLARVGGARVIDIAGFDHRCCWQQRWPELAAQSCLGSAAR
jgi:pimeloyl-ACP methyl ester carboxylesterase